MAIKKVEIRGIGKFEIKNDYLHRGIYPRLETYDKGRFKKIQFDNYRDNLDQYLLHDGWQRGYDYDGNEIYIKVLK